MEQNCYLLSKRAFPLIHTHTVMQCHQYLFVLSMFFENLIINQGSVTANTPTINNEKDEVNFTVNLKNKGTVDADFSVAITYDELPEGYTKEDLKERIHSVFQESGVAVWDCELI